MYKKFEELPQDLQNKFDCYNITAKTQAKRDVYTNRAKNSYVEFINLLEEKGHKLVSNYCGNQKKLVIDFCCGHKPHSLRPHDYKLGGGCKECFKIKQSERVKEEMKDITRREILSNYTKEQWKTGSLKELWKGATPITEHLRQMRIMLKWRKDTYERENFKCQLTGKIVHGGNSDVHHLKGFSIIVQEAHYKNNIEFKPVLKDYTENEMFLLEKYITEWHKDTTNAVLLSEDVHMLFHSLYGKGNNTPEQYIEFKERYLAGEFKEILN